ncbi:hypothetical protein PFISCL1PPCAC_3698, partial [Pristionchus fissidentatus]
FASLRTVIHSPPPAKANNPVCDAGNCSDEPPPFFHPGDCPNIAADDLCSWSHMEGYCCKSCANKVTCPDFSSLYEAVRSPLTLTLSNSACDLGNCSDDPPAHFPAGICPKVREADLCSWSHMKGFCCKSCANKDTCPPKSPLATPLELLLPKFLPNQACAADNCSDETPQFWPKGGCPQVAE